MRFRKRYLILVECSGSVRERFYDYLQYQVNFCMIDSTAFMIDSYLDPDELTEYFRANISASARAFVCEITGEMTWRNTKCGNRELNRFLNKSLLT